MPAIDPVAITLGSLQLRWYGLMYVLAFGLGWWLARRRAARPGSGWNAREVDDLLTCVMLGIILACLTLLKTGTYFAGSACLMPLRTGIVRDIRVDIYKKILSLPLSFFSEERKGDIVHISKYDECCNWKSMVFSKYYS